MPEQSMGYLRCGSHKLEIIRIEFAKGVAIVWGFARGPLYAYAGPVQIFGWDGIEFWGTEDNEENFSSFPRVGNGENLFLPVVLGNGDSEDFRVIIEERKKELESSYPGPRQLEGA